MDNEKLGDLLKSLPLSTQTLLAQAAEAELRTEWCQLIWMAEKESREAISRAVADGRIPKSSDPSAVHVRAFRSPLPRQTPQASEQ